MKAVKKSKILVKVTMILLSVILFSCQGNVSKQNKESLNSDSSKIEQDVVDSIADYQLDEEMTSEDSISQEMSEDSYLDASTEVGENVVEGTKEKEIKLETVTFCDCVKKQSEIDKKMEAAESDEEIDAVMNEMDEMTNGPCKELLNDKQSSPEQREKRKQKIADCLK